VVLIFITALDARAWTCKTHIFIAREAGITEPAAACFPDMTRKENDALLGPFHWHNPAPDAVVTAEYIERFGVSSEVFVKQDAYRAYSLSIKVPDPAGVLYWKICDLYGAMKGAGRWEHEYYLTVIAHYVGDLSQPLHNFPSGRIPAADGRSYPDVGIWAKSAHLSFDMALDPYLPLQAEEDRAIIDTASRPAVNSMTDLKREIARIANASLALANACYREKRGLTKKEALTQAAMSINLLKAVIEGTKSR
jgi:hypothetical protein